jgi:hypothetical protein
MDQPLAIFQKRFSARALHQNPAGTHDACSSGVHGIPGGPLSGARVLRL